ncbi:CocE/NonD family hydrolase [Salinisphaera sp. S4-8]|uniref:CocE/NonD family hydrolase n=1 Tax=Salinisphaera sp. S4-8 TaxID=633357 RepID=UPI00333FB5D1
MLQQYSFRRASRVLGVAVLALSLLGLAACNDDSDAVNLGTDSQSQSGSTPDGGDTPGATPGSTLTPGGDASNAVVARDYNAVVTNPKDGTDIAITVLQPALAPGEAAPLILHSHGFGGTRLRGRDQNTLYETLTGGTLPSAEAARRAAAAGYFVISFDERGFGQSEGQVEVIDPDFEGEDIKAILNWAEQQMDNRGHLGYRDGDLAVGALGLSYGGGFQLVGAAVDPRFDAIVPTVGWYDLLYSLSPGDVIKSDWGVLLVALGIPTSQVRLDPLLYQALVEGLAAPLTQRGFSADVRDKLYNNSPRSFCESRESAGGELGPSASGRVPAQVDALIIQGVADTLFTLNEGWANAQCLRAAGNEVHFVGMRFGHTLPVLQSLQSQDRVAYSTEATLHCGRQTFDTATLELDYLNWKLRGTPLPQPIPSNCVTVTDNQGVALNTLPVADPATGNGYSVSAQATTGGLSLLLDLLRTHTVDDLVDALAVTVDNATDIVDTLLNPQAGVPTDATPSFVLAQLINALPADQIDELLSGGTFVPLTTVERAGQALVGIPVADIQITGGGVAPVAFLGIGVRRDANESAELVNKQVRPVRGTGEQRVELNGLSRPLQVGDEIGLMIYGFHPQYVASFSTIPGVIDVQGQVGLPIVDLPDAQVASPAR